MKFIPSGFRKDDKYFNHDGHYGLPVSFTRKDKDWKVNFGPGKKSINDAKAAMNNLTRKEKKFITAVVDNIGDDILDYWQVKNPNTKEGIKELDNIVKRIEDKYEK